MAATDVGRRLTEEHRRAQVALTARTVGRLILVGRLLTPGTLGDPAVWETAALAVVRADRRRSAALAAAYLTRFRAAERGVAAAAPVMDAADIPAGRARAALQLVGPVAAKARIARGVPPETAVEQSRVGAARAGMRQVADGGRGVLTDTVAADPQADGWFRVTDSGPCAFCALLASRGLYRSEDSGDFQAHDGCNCGVEPRYRRDAEWPGRAREFAAEYRRATAATPGVPPLIAFRRAHEGRG